MNRCQNRFATGQCALTVFGGCHGSQVPQAVVVVERKLGRSEETSVGAWGVTEHVGTGKTNRYTNKKL